MSFPLGVLAKWMELWSVCCLRGVDCAVLELVVIGRRPCFTSFPPLALLPLPLALMPGRRMQTVSVVLVALHACCKCTISHFECNFCGGCVIAVGGVSFAADTRGATEEGEAVGKAERKRVVGGTLSGAACSSSRPIGVSRRE